MKEGDLVRNRIEESVWNPGPGGRGSTKWARLPPGTNGILVSQCSNGAWYVRFEGTVGNAVVFAGDLQLITALDQIVEALDA